MTQVCYNQQALFVRFDCDDRDIWGISTQRDDPIYDEEVVEVFIGPGEATPVAAVPAAAGIPLTHRGLSAQVRVVSGRSADGEVELGPVHGAETLVLFMALNELDSLCERLLH